MVTMSWRMSAIRRGLTPQVFATNSLHLLCTFIEHTETMFIKNNETMFIEHTETIYCGLERRDRSTFALKALLCQAVEEGATVVAPSELHVVVDFEPGKDRM